MKHAFSKALRSKGWTAAEVAERWGMSRQAVSKLAANPTKRDWDALVGLPDRKDPEKIQRCA